MRRLCHLLLTVVLAGKLLAAATLCLASDYAWLPAYDPSRALEKRFAPPPGFERVVVDRGSFQEWLRRLPLKPGAPPVMLHDGRTKGNQAAHLAVVDIDVGPRDLQQCADAIIRLRAEYLFAQQALDRIRFTFTNGASAPFSRWVEGYRPSIKGAHVTWRKAASADRSHSSLRDYLDVVFSYAGTASLARELQPVSDRSTLQIGDVLIQGGFPGHAVIVVDMAESQERGEMVFALAQSYMPAQDIHILRNPQDPSSPWYPLPFGEQIETPEWTFRASHLKRFP